MEGDSQRRRRSFPKSGYALAASWLLFLVFSSSAAVAQRNADGVEGAGPAPPENRAKEIPRAAAKNQAPKDPPAVRNNFMAVEAMERALKLQQRDLLRRFKPDAPACRAVERQLLKLEQEKQGLLSAHPPLAREHRMQKAREDERKRFRAELKVLEAREDALRAQLDETTRKRELLLERHPELAKP